MSNIMYIVQCIKLRNNNDKLRVREIVFIHYQITIFQEITNDGSEN